MKFVFPRIESCLSGILRLTIPKTTTWEEVRDEILLAIEEEERNKAIPSISTVMSADLPSCKPSAPTNAGTVMYGSTADQSFHFLSKGDVQEYLSTRLAL